MILKSIQRIIIMYFLVAVYGCNEPIELDYCQMRKLDQSHVNYDTTDMVKHEEDRQIRNSLFKANYDDLVAYSNQSGFPNADKNNPADSCKYWAILATFIHIAQSDPDLFFSPENTEFVKREIDNGNLDPEFVAPALRVIGNSPTAFLCLSLKGVAEKTIRSWEMDRDLFVNLKFKDCSKE